MLHADITKQIIGGYYDVYNDLGWGFSESVYASVMQLVLTQRGLLAQREVSYRVFYGGYCHGEFRCDLVVNDVVVVELKARPQLIPAHEAQLLNYLRASGVGVGLLLNFGPKPAVKRLIWTAQTQRLEEG